MCEGVAQEVGPEHDSQQAMQEAKLRVADREQPRREPETTDADLLRHWSAPRPGLLALLSLGVDVHLEHELDVAGQRVPICPGKLHQSLFQAWHVIRSSDTRWSLLAGATLAVSKLAIRVRKHGAPHGEWLLPVVGRDQPYPAAL